LWLRPGKLIGGPPPPTPCTVSGTFLAQEVSPLEILFISIGQILGEAFVLQYIWDFGDGSPTESYTTNTNTTHTYAAPGIYPASLTLVTSNGCDRVIDKFVAVPTNCGMAPTIDGGVFLATSANNTALRLTSISFTDLLNLNGGTQLDLRAWGYCCAGSVYFEIIGGTRVDDTTFIWNGMEFKSDAFDPSGTMSVPSASASAVFATPNQSLVVNQIGTIDPNVNPEFIIHSACGDDANYILDLTGTPPVWCNPQFQLLIETADIGGANPVLGNSVIIGADDICNKQFRLVLRNNGPDPCCNGTPMHSEIAGGTRLSGTIIQTTGVQFFGFTFDPSFMGWTVGLVGSDSYSPAFTLSEYANLPLSFNAYIFQVTVCGVTVNTTIGISCIKPTEWDANYQVGGTGTPYLPLSDVTYDAGDLIAAANKSLYRYVAYCCYSGPRTFAMREYTSGGVFVGNGSQSMSGTSFTLPNGVSIYSVFFQPGFDQASGDCGGIFFELTWGGITLASDFDVEIDMTDCKGTKTFRIRIRP
jgi:hypothetical protein